MEKYVISQDIFLLLNEWANKKGFVIPKVDFFTNLRQEMKEYLESIFGINQVQYAIEKEIIFGINELILKIPNNISIVTIDKVYCKKGIPIEINRAVDNQLNSISNYPRFSRKSILNQIKNISNQKISKIALVDDVVFTGELIADLNLLFNQHSIKIDTVIGGVIIKKGFDKITNLGIKVEPVKYYHNIIDEICERDFYPGVPYSGRLVIDDVNEIGAPYLLPFGKPRDWASIPDHYVNQFSQFCLKQSIKLWEEIELLSKKTIRCSDLDRIPIGFRPCQNFIDCLYQSLNLIAQKETAIVS